MYSSSLARFCHSPHPHCQGCAAQPITRHSTYRFNTSVQFGLPDEACRVQILQQYAKHLKEEDLATIAEVTPGLAGRDLKDLSEQAERRWASKVPPCMLHDGLLVLYISRRHHCLCYGLAQGWTGPVVCRPCPVATSASKQAVWPVFVWVNGNCK